MRGIKSWSYPLTPALSPKGARGYLIAGLIVGLGLLSLGIRADDLGRLFTTPEEREMLETLRNQPRRAEAPTEQPLEPEALAPEPPPVQSVRVDGFVSRSRGNNTVWINGTNSLTGDLGSQQVDVNVRGIRGQTVPVRVQNSPVGVGLKPGQTFDPTDSRVVDLYQETNDAETASDNASPASESPR
ncbi:MAG: hypothetical protein M3436_09175 [Pseudomonadota bacterium]|nr:hypothetical protein [Pseudomonadota bacterium]